MDNNSNYTDYGKDGIFDKPPKRKMNWLRFALMLIIIGGIMAGGAWMTGARGGTIGWNRGPLFFATPIGSGETHNISVRPQGINELIIYSSSARVTIRTNHRSNDFAIEFQGLPPNYDVSGGTLTVDARPAQVIRGINFFGFGFGGYAVSVDVPAGMALDVRVSSSSGGVDIRHPNFGELQVSTSSGRIEIERTEASDGIWLSASSGRISAEYVVAPSGSFSSSSGRIEISDSHFDNLNVSSSSGRQEIEDVSWQNLQASSSSGRISIDDARIRLATGSTNISASSGSINLTVDGNESDFNYYLRSNSGSIRVNGERRETRNIGNLHDINIRTTSGSIRLNFD